MFTSRALWGWPTIISCAAAVLSVAAAVAAGFLLNNYMQSAPFVSLFLCAIIFVAWVFGVGAGLLATALSTIAFAYYFVPLDDSMVMDAKTIPRIVLFAITALVVVSISAAQRRATESLRLTYDDLQHAVQKLEALNEALRVENAERRRVEQKLRQAEHELRIIVDTIPAFVWSALPDGSLDFVNRRWTELGLSLEDLQGSNWIGVIHPDECDRVADSWRAAVRAGKPYESLERVRCSDREYRWFLSRADPLRDELGNIIKWYGFDTDIEEQKRAEESLHEKASLLDLTHDTIFVRDASDVITYWNRGAEELYGWNREHAIGRVSHQLMQTIFPEPLASIRDKLKSSGRWEGRLVHTKRDGTRVIVASRWSMRQDQRGRFSGTLETNNDITEHQRAEDALRRSEAELAEAQRLSLTGSFRWNTVLKTHHWSDQAYRLLEYEPQLEPSSDLFLQRVHPEDRDFIQRTLEQAFQTGRGFDIEHRLLMPDGSIKYLHAVAHLMKDDSEHLEVVGAATDITTIKRANEELQRTQAELARVTRLTTMGQLAASIAHEINQPLTGVITNGATCLHWLADETIDIGKARRAAGRIVRDGQRASDVVDRIRGLMTKSAHRETEVDMHGLVKDVLVLIRTELQAQRVSARTELKARSSFVRGDRVQLQQVVLNLIMNGIEAMLPVTNRHRILVIGSRLEGSGDLLVFVRDHGTGIRPEIMDKLFEPFFTTKSEGIGMGLAICRSIVETHSGRLWASAAAPHGSVFQFTLPITTPTRS
jgi:PAS domain S-box-containing protein